MAKKTIRRATKQLGIPYTTTHGHLKSDNSSKVNFGRPPIFKSFGLAANRKMIFRLPASSPVTILTELTQIGLKHQLSQTMSVRKGRNCLCLIIRISRIIQ